MQTARATKTTTALSRALRSAGLDAGDKKAIVRALRDAARDGKLTTGATISVYPDGWLPNSYRYPAPGRKIEIEIAPFGVTVTEARIDRKRSGGGGPRVTVYARREGQTQGARVASL